MIKFSLEEAEEDAPLQWVVGEFAHGPVPASRHLVKRQASHGPGDTIAVALETRELALEGVGARGRLVVGILDAKRKRIRLLPEATGAAVPLAHRVKGYQAQEPEDHSAVNRGTYVREFASHREHRRLKMYTDAYVGAEQVAISDHLQQAQLAARQSMAAYASDRNANVPAYNEAADSASDVYSLRSIMDERLENALLTLMQERFNEGKELHERPSPLARNYHELALAQKDTLDAHLQDFYVHSIEELAKLEDTEARRRHILAMGFALAAAVHLPSKKDRNLPRETFQSTEHLFRAVTKILDETFGVEAEGGKYHVISDSGRTKLVNFATVAMMLASTSHGVRMAHLRDCFRVTDKIARAHAGTCGMWAPGTTTADSEKKREFASKLEFRLKFPLKFLQSKLQKRPQSFGTSKEDPQGGDHKLREAAGQESSFGSSKRREWNAEVRAIEMKKKEAERAEQDDF